MRNLLFSNFKKVIIDALCVSCEQKLGMHKPNNNLNISNLLRDVISFYSLYCKLLYYYNISTTVFNVSKCLYTLDITYLDHNDVLNFIIILGSIPVFYENFFKYTRCTISYIYNSNYILLITLVVSFIIISFYYFYLVLSIPALLIFKLYGFFIAILNI